MNQHNHFRTAPALPVAVRANTFRPVPRSANTLLRYWRIGVIVCAVVLVVLGGVLGVGYWLDF